MSDKTGFFLFEAQLGWRDRPGQDKAPAPGQIAPSFDAGLQHKPVVVCPVYLVEEWILADAVLSAQFPESV